jgi:Zn-dependent protease with chaperone function
MATDFFERQDAARRSTKWLVGMFLLGAIGIVGATAAVGVIAAEAARDRTHESGASMTSLGVTEESIALGIMAGLASLVLIIGGSTYKVAALSGGGNVVAEGLGGRRVFPDTTDPVERRLLNVVEEMALASGVPVPPVFLLSEEEGINAFAAGYSPSDAVVAVTRGTAERLSRDELQGVVAHEFSHILNGDMRLNIRLIGILHGILLIGLIGRILLRLASNSGSRSGKDGKGAAAYIGLIGVALMVLGYVGTLVGNLIKAAVSRQREFLADASAVQFTRNPGGLAGALKRIGAAITGSSLKAPNAAEASHMFFAQGVWEGFTGLTATHPPLEDRIRRLDPQWDGTYPAEPVTPAQFSKGRGRGAALVGEPATAAMSGEDSSEFVPVTVVAHAADQVGDPSEAHRSYAAALVASLLVPVLQAVHEPYGARAVLYGLLLDRKPEIRERQLSRLEQLATADMPALTQKLLPYLDLLDVRARLPLVDLALPSLRAMSPTQYRQFMSCFKELVAADNRLGLFEWTLYRIVLRHLRPQFENTAAPPTAYYGLQRMGPQCSVLLSTLAHADNRRGDAPAAFARGAAKLPGVKVSLLAPEQCGLEALSRSLDDLARVADKKRRHLVDACAACICADREVTVAEAELLRGVCDMLNCPMPPLLPGGPVTFAHEAAVA